MTRQKGERYVRVPQWWLHAVSMYGGRLSALERSVLDTVVHFIWGWSGAGRTSASIGMAEFRNRMPTRTREGIRRALCVLRTPGDELHTWNSGRGQKRGHGMVVMERAPTSRRESVYSIQEDWRLWGWEEGTDFASVGETLDRLYGPQGPALQWTSEAEQLAKVLWTMAIEGFTEAEAGLPVPADGVVAAARVRGQPDRAGARLRRL